MIHIISMWHNEALLAPLFMDHYKRADKITLILDDCTDDTRNFIDGVELYEIGTGSLDDINKAYTLSQVANDSDADVRIVVDADEFIYPLSDDLEVLPGEVYSVGLWEVFRHGLDKDIDLTQPPLQQRKHGNPQRGQSFGQDHFIKPIVFGKDTIINLLPGNHSLGNGLDVIDDCFDGVHWAMADPVIALHRRGLKRARMSTRNKQLGLTSHDWNVTAPEILGTCGDYVNAKEVIITDRERF